MLTVIAIIGILAAMLMPVLAAAKTHAQKTQAKMEIKASSRPSRVTIRITADFR